MLTKEADKKREQIKMFCMDDQVPQDHLLRIIDKAINWNFIYDQVEDQYSSDTGRPSMDPVMLRKINMNYVENGAGTKVLTPLCLQSESGILVIPLFLARRK